MGIISDGDWESGGEVLGTLLHYIPCLLFNTLSRQLTCSTDSRSLAVAGFSSSVMLSDSGQTGRSVTLKNIPEIRPLVLISLLN